jgi:hypothetical protein
MNKMDKQYFFDERGSMVWLKNTKRNSKEAGKWELRGIGARDLKIAEKENERGRGTHVLNVNIGNIREGIKYVAE